MIKFIVFLLLSVFSSTYAQQTTKLFSYDGLSRSYIEYVPSIYDGTIPVPVVLNLHGLGDTKENFCQNGLHLIADTANFIVLTPQAINAPGFGTAWNSGAGLQGFELNASIDDVGFLNTLLDSIIEDYKIDTSRIFCTGFSMGGFMTQRMACEATDRIAAVASIAGTQGNNLPTCTPSRQIAVAHFHGTTDATVGYTANDYGNNVEELINFWSNHNDCSGLTDSTRFDDSMNDGVTVDHFNYNSCYEENTLQLFRINDLGHNWCYNPVYDIDYAKEVWKFFYKHKLKTSTANINQVKTQFKVYPNATKKDLNFPNEYKPYIKKVYSTDGKLVKTDTKNENYINVSDLSKGLYIIEINGESAKFLKK